MDFFERSMAYVTKNIFKISDIDKATDITILLIGLVGFAIKTLTLLVISPNFTQFFIFFLPFGALRWGKGEHYKLWVLCYISTILVFLCYLFLIDLLQANLLVGLVISIFIALFFIKRP